MFLTFILIICASLFAATYFWFKSNFSYWQRYPQIPSVNGRIFSGNFKEFAALKTNFGFHLKNIYDDEKFKNAAVVGIYSLYKPALLIREPELIKSIFIKDFNLFRNRTCEGGSHDPIGALNIFFAKYPYWKEMRSKLIPLFSSGKIKYKFPLMQKIGEQFEGFLNKQPQCLEVDLLNLCGRYTSDVIHPALLGISSNSLENPKDLLFTEILKLVEFNLKRALSFLIICFAPKLHALGRPKVFNESSERFFRATVKHLMAERESTGSRGNDLIDVFLKMKQEGETNGIEAAHCLEGIVSQTCIVLTAGYDATCNTLYFTLLALAKNPGVQQKLREQILQVFLNQAGDLTYESLSGLEYLQMVITETHRMYPNLYMLDRMHEFLPNTSKGFSLKPFYDYELPNEMPVYISAIGMNHDAKFWPNPQKFEPERFSAANKKEINQMSFMPYGAGPHMCLGFALGMLLVKVALVYFLRNHYVRAGPEVLTEPEFDAKSFVLLPKVSARLEVVRDNLYAEKLSSI